MRASLARLRDEAVKERESDHAQYQALLTQYNLLKKRKFLSLFFYFSVDGCVVSYSLPLFFFKMKKV